MIWRFGDFVLDSTRFRLMRRDGSVVGIQPKAFKVLEILVRNAPNVVSRQDLLTEAWGHCELSVSALSQSIHEIRRALCDDAIMPTYIGTRHGEGYFLLVETAVLKGPKAFWSIAKLPVERVLIAATVICASLLAGIVICMILHF